MKIPILSQLEKGLNKVVGSVGKQTGLWQTGGNYADAGAQDTQIREAEKTRQLQEMLQKLGIDILGTQGRAPDQDSMAKFHQAQAAVDAYTNAGLTPPEGIMSDFSNALDLFKTSSGLPTGTMPQGWNPYTLDPNQTTALNQTTDQLTGGRQAQIRKVKADMAARGLTGSSQEEALLRRIGSTYDTGIAKAGTDFRENVRANREHAAGMLPGYLLSGGQFQEMQRANRLGEKKDLVSMYGNNISMGSNLLNTALQNQWNLSNLYGGVAGANTQKSQMAGNTLGSLAGLGMANPQWFQPRKRQPYFDPTMPGA